MGRDGRRDGGRERREDGGYTGGTLDPEGRGDTRLDYIELPLTLGAIFAPEGKPYRARLYSGISVGFKVSCSSDLVECDNAKGTEWAGPSASRSPT
jgi:hypothetical protein